MLAIIALIKVINAFFFFSVVYDLCTGDVI